MFNKFAFLVAVIVFIILNVFYIIFTKDNWNDIVFKITPQHSVNHLLKFKNACNTHPHNFYIQLLAETGLIGFIFIFSLFIYLLLHIVKNIFFKYFNDSEICILIGLHVYVVCVYKYLQVYVTVYDTHTSICLFI